MPIYPRIQSTECFTADDFLSCVSNAVLYCILFGLSNKNKNSNKVIKWKRWTYLYIPCKTTIRYPALYISCEFVIPDATSSCSARGAWGLTFAIWLLLLSREFIRHLPEVNVPVEIKLLLNLHNPHVNELNFQIWKISGLCFKIKMLSYLIDIGTRS